jgi:Putative beta-barrel porin 2
MMKLPLLSLLALSAIAQPFAAQAQTDPSRTASAVDSGLLQKPLLDAEKADSYRTIHEENAFALPTPGDNDIGDQLILKRNDRSYPWRVSIDSAEFWTDNAANAKSGHVDDWFWVGGVTIGYQPRIAGRFFLDASVGQHWFLYDKTSDLNFESGEATAGLIVLLPELANSLFHVHYYYQRITQGLGDSPIYTTHDIRAGLQKTFLIDRTNSVNLGLETSFAVDAAPDALRRNEYSFLTGYNYKLKKNIILSASYRGAYYDYTDAGRHDWYHNFGAGITYRPREWVELGLSYNFTVNRSSRDQFSYESQLAGPALTLKAKF